MELERNGVTLESTYCVVLRGTKSRLENEICRWANGSRENVTFDGDTALVDAPDVKGEVYFRKS